MRARVYIDGFNFYYGVVHGTQYRWLNLLKLVNELFPRHDIEHVLYATARIRNAPWDRGKSVRQKQYLSALATLPDHFEIVEGSFSSKIVGAHVPNPPAHNGEYGSTKLRNLWAVGGDGCLERAKVINSKRLKGLEGSDYPQIDVVKIEEKGTDVTLGARMVFDACREDFDAAILISNDSDLIEPVRLVRREIGLKVIQVVPTRPASGKYRGRKSVFRDAVDEVYHEINESILLRCQFPDPVVGRDGELVRKPNGW